MTERIVAAAIRWRGNTFSLPTPARHADVLHAIWNSANQLIPRKGGYAKGEVMDAPGRDLFSEDVW